MRIGDIFLFKDINQNEYPIRVIAFDDIEIFYDTKLVTDNWFLDGKKTFIFPRMSRQFFDLNSFFIGYEPIGDKDLERFKSYLPIRMARYKNINWVRSDIHSQQIDSDLVLKINEIYLIPFGKNGAMKSPLLFHSQSNNDFSEVELIHTAFEIQNVEFKNFEGVGLYRSGGKNGIPTYYLGGYIDRADICS